MEGGRAREGEREIRCLHMLTLLYIERASSAAFALHCLAGDAYLLSSDYLRERERLATSFPKRLAIDRLILLCNLLLSLSCVCTLGFCSPLLLLHDLHSVDFPLSPILQLFVALNAWTACALTGEQGNQKKQQVDGNAYTDIALVHL